MLGFAYHEDAFSLLPTAHNSFHVDSLVLELDCPNYLHVRLKNSSLHTE